MVTVEIDITTLCRVQPVNGHVSKVESPSQMGDMTVVPQRSNKLSDTDLHDGNIRTIVVVANTVCEEREDVDSRSIWVTYSRFKYALSHTSCVPVCANINNSCGVTSDHDIVPDSDLNNPSVYHNCGSSCTQSGVDNDVTEDPDHATESEFENAPVTPNCGTSWENMGDTNGVTCDHIKATNHPLNPRMGSLVRVRRHCKPGQMVVVEKDEPATPKVQTDKYQGTQLWRIVV